MTNKPSQMFLIGGGWNPEAFRFTYGPFVESSARDGRRRIAIVVVLEQDTDKTEQEANYRGALETLGVTHDEVVPVFLSESRPLSLKMLSEINPTGLLVCGGLTPLYQELLCGDGDWVSYLLERDLPYCGFSAGSAIVAGKAVVGGWKATVNGAHRPIVDEEVSEELELLTVRDGLGWLPFSIDVHCGQWGTITRLIHAVTGGMIECGVGIDENTMLQVNGDTISVHGLGQVYRVRRGSDVGVTVEIFRDGVTIDM